MVPAMKVRQLTPEARANQKAYFFRARFFAASKRPVTESSSTGWSGFLSSAADSAVFN